MENAENEFYHPPYLLYNLFTLTLALVPLITI